MLQRATEHTAPRVPAMRLPDWQHRFGDLVHARAQTPFAWGSHDCCLWAADAVHAITGVDLAADLRGAYASEPDAAALLNAAGGLYQLAKHRLGRSVRVKMAQIGDIGMAAVDAVPSLVVCAGAHFLAPGRDGLTAILPASVLRVWRCTQCQP